MGESVTDMYGVWVCIVCMVCGKELTTCKVCELGCGVWVVNCEVSGLGIAAVVRCEVWVCVL